MTLRQRVYGSAVVIMVLMVTLAVVATVQLEGVGSETSRLSKDADHYIALTRTLEKATALLRLPGAAAAGGRPEAAVVAQPWSPVIWRYVSPVRRVDAPG